MDLKHAHEIHTSTGTLTSVYEKPTATDLSPSSPHHRVLLKACFQWALHQLLLSFLRLLQVILSQGSQAPLLYPASLPLFFQSVRDCRNDQTDINSPGEYLIVKDHMCLCHDGPSLLVSYLSGHGAPVYTLPLYCNPQLRTSVKPLNAPRKFKIRSNLCGWLYLLQWMTSKHEAEARTV